MAEISFSTMTFINSKFIWRPLYVVLGSLTDDVKRVTISLEKTCRLPFYTILTYYQLHGFHSSAPVLVATVKGFTQKFSRESCLFKKGKEEGRNRAHISFKHIFIMQTKKFFFDIHGQWARTRLTLKEGGFLGDIWLTF